MSGLQADSELLGATMYIVLDTNVFIADVSLASEKVRLLIDYAQRTESPIVVSDVALLELEAHIKRRLEEHIAKLSSAADAIELLTGRRPNFSDVPDPEAEAKTYMERVMNRYRIAEKRILKSKPEHLSALVQRSVRRVKPFSDRGEGFRDALIWLQIAAIGAESKRPDEIAFISANTRDFAQEGSLHPVLRAEAEAAKLNIQYFPSLDVFLKAHADKIAFITTEFLEALLNVHDIEDAAGSSSELAKNVEGWFRRRHDAPGYSKVIQVLNLSLDDFYVYPGADGKWTVIGIYVGEAEVEGDVYEYSRDPDWYGERLELRTVLKYPRVTVQVELTISGTALQDWNVIETDIDG